MKKRLIFITSVLLVCILSLNTFAYQKRALKYAKPQIKRTADDLFFEDFSTYELGSNPTSFAIREYENFPVEVVETETPSAKRKNVLKMTDTGKSGSYCTITVPEYNGPLVFEMRVKAVKTTTDSFGFDTTYFDENGGQAFTLKRWSGGTDPWWSYGNSGGLLTLTRDINHNNEWFTIKVRFDPATKTCGLLIENEQLRTKVPNIGRSGGIYHEPAYGRVKGVNLPWMNEAGSRVAKIQFNPYGSDCGEYYIDYIKITKNVPAYTRTKERAEGALIETIADPAPRAVPGLINVTYKGEIKYFANPVIELNKIAMIDADELANLYGMELKGTGEAYELKGKDKSLTFTLNSEIFKCDSKEYVADAQPKIVGEIIYVPLSSFATVLGSEVSWSDDLSAVTVE